MRADLQLTPRDVADITKVLGPRLFDLQDADFQPSLEEIENYLVKMMDVTCEYRSFRNGKKINVLGCEGPIEELSLRYGVHPLSNTIHGS